ncbi:MAG: GTP pyrophosphokinase family protein [Clostridia bacterium]
MEKNNTLNKKQLDGIDGYEKLKDFVKLGHLYRGAIKEVSTKLEILDDEFQYMFEHNPIHHMESRMKSFQSVRDKLIRKGFEFSTENMCEHVMDIAGIRVVCNYINDLYSLADMIQQQDDITLINRKDYIAHPKENGYRSLHLIVTVPVFTSKKPLNIPVEIQLRTIAMDMWASLEHELKYKSEKLLPTQIADELRECATDLASIDKRMQEIYLMESN